MTTLSIDQLAGKFVAYGSRDWDQACQAAVRQAAAWTGGAPTPNYLSAIEAYRASKIVSRDALKATINAVHYWAIGRYGHVAGDIGGGRVFMASSHIDHAWATNIGTTTVAAYTRETGATYLGWARSNGHNVLKLRANSAPTPKPATPTGKRWTTAHAGEGFVRIASRLGVTVAALEEANPRLDGGNLNLGQRVYY